MSWCDNYVHGHFFQHEGWSYRERQSQCQLHFSSGCSAIREKEPSRKNTRAPTFRIWFQSLLRACKMWQVTMVHMDRTFVSKIRWLGDGDWESKLNCVKRKSSIYSFHQYGRRLSRQVRRITKNKDIALRIRHSKNSFIWPIPESVVNGRCACCWLGTNRSTTRNPIQWPFFYHVDMTEIEKK